MAQRCIILVKALHCCSVYPTITYIAWPFFQILHHFVPDYPDKLRDLQVYQLACVNADMLMHFIWCSYASIIAAFEFLLAAFFAISFQSPEPTDSEVEFASEKEEVHHLSDKVIEMQPAHNHFAALDHIPQYLPCSGLAKNLLEWTCFSKGVG